MAVALATLPLKSLLAGEGEWWMVAATGSGRAAWVAGALAAGAAGLAALPCTGRGAGFFAAALLAGFATARAGDFAATLAACPLPATGFDLTALVPALLGVLPLCALAAVELALVFAISLHPDWPWGPRVIADAFNTGKPASGILVPLHGARRFGIREHPLPIHTVVAWFVQALAQPPAWPSLPLPPQLFRLCTDCGHPLRSVAGQPAGRMATAALPAAVSRRRRSGAGTFSFCELPRPRRAA